MSHQDPRPAEERTPEGLHAALLERACGPQAPLRVLDVGCGSGAWLGRLALAGCTNAVGIDRNVAGYRGPVARLVQANLDRDPVDLGDKISDLVSAIEVVEHLENPGRLFDLAARHLVPGGRFLLTPPHSAARSHQRSVFARRQVPVFNALGQLVRLDERGGA